MFARSHAPPPLALSETSRALALRLAATGRFALGPIGFPPTTSTGEKLTLTLSREPDAIEAFTWLGQLPLPAPRLYAYWALRTLDAARATALADQLRRDRGDVEQMSGCLMSSAAVTDVLAELDQASAHGAMPPP